MHHQRDHHGQPARPGMISQVAVPDPHDITQHPERHHRVVTALMLDQHIDERLPAIQRHGEQQIGMPPPQRGIHQTPGHERQLVQVKPGHQPRWQYRPHLGRRVRRRPQNPAEHRIMRRGRTRHNRTVPTPTDTPARQPTTRHQPTGHTRHPLLPVRTAGLGRAILGGVRGSGHARCRRSRSTGRAERSCCV